MASTCSTPRPLVALACGSRSTSRTFFPSSARAALRLIEVVVLPTPPFWFATAIIFTRAVLGMERRVARGSCEGGRDSSPVFVVPALAGMNGTAPEESAPPAGNIIKRAREFHREQRVQRKALSSATRVSRNNRCSEGFHEAAGWFRLKPGRRTCVARLLSEVPLR
jgi:hypothetical protein